jgi:elongation factor P
VAEVQTLRKGDIYEEENQLWRVLEYQHIKVARGGATIRLKLRNVRSGATVERTYSNGTRVNDVQLDNDEVQYLYHDDDNYYFMNTTTFEQVAVSPAFLEGVRDYLVDEMTVMLQSYEGESISVKIPTTVELRVVWAEPAIQGDTANAPMKQVELQTGLRIQAPLFVQEGDLLRVDTREGTYITRVR